MTWILMMDVQAINQTTDIAGLIGGLKHSGRYYIGPCPFCGGQDRFNVKEVDGAQLWICRGCGDGRYHDAVTFLMKRDGLTFRQLVGSQADPLLVGEATNQPSQAARPALDCPPNEDWQTAGLLAAKGCCERLHGREGDAAAAYDYLVKQRGLSPETIFNASLGYNPAWLKVGPDCWLAPGITIPGMIGGDLWYVQVRTTKAARWAAAEGGRRLDRYCALTGSRLKALFGADKLLQAETAVITEGEFDALLLGQFLPQEWAAVTMGAANTLPDNPVWLRYFAAIRRAYLVMDNDQAGQTAVSKWWGLLPWVDLQPVPGGHKDVTDYWRAGSDIAAWLLATP